jgi:hypothetical protein
MLNCCVLIAVHDEQEGEGQETFGGHGAQAAEGAHPPKRFLVEQCELKNQFKLKLKQTKYLN